MSVDNIEALIRSAESDPALAGELRGLKDLDGLVAIGAERGLPFTSAELEAYFAALPSTELSEQELSSIAGGTGGAHVAISLGDGRTDNRGPYLAFSLKKTMISS
jgi:predicted ribosomally synthesized peptide with nif11-like leader